MKAHCDMKSSWIMGTSIFDGFARPFTHHHARCIWLLPALITLLNLLPAGRVTAQTFTTLHSFTPTINSGPPYPTLTNSDGAEPLGELIANASGSTLYGTTTFGGSSGVGTVFAVNTDGTGFTNLYSFTANNGPGYTDYTNSDGAYPYAGLTLSGNTLYGTARAGGTHKNGTVFAVNTDGTGFTNLHTFIGSDGANPDAGLILSGNTLYGTTTAGSSSGSANNGTVFAVNTDGTGFTNLHSFAAGGYDPSNGFTNSDGANPEAGLILSGQTLYGTATLGGSWGNGTVFALNTDGTGFTNLHTFTAVLPYPGPSTNGDGGAPFARLILATNTLYGTAARGGAWGNGTVFSLNTDGTGFTSLHSFSGLPDRNPQTNSDGASPNCGLALSGNTLYGTAESGGSSGRGTVFSLNTDGTGFTSLHSLAGNEGSLPYGGLVLSANTIYGTASGGGIAGGNGTVFSLSFRPQLTITFPGDRPVLSWPVNSAGFSYTGFYLQYTKGTNSDAVWTDLVYLPIIANGRFEVAVPWALFLGQNSSSFRLKQ
jgi:uncharacterized repeat protein (TIGR03803 family)